MQFETLSKCHATKLLDFELANKAWFESLIEARESSFYTPKGVAAHIDALSKAMALGTGYSGVLVKNNIIVARANLKSIYNNKATVGYRVAKNSISQGFASYCLVQLLEVAQNKYDIKHLKAQVLENNPASMHVLQKHNFKIRCETPNFLTFNNRKLSCTEFELINR